jgi:NADPH:quinone reductase-like Zn-dependent oxidoreductase
VAVALDHGASVTGSARSTAADQARALGVDTVVDFDFDPGTLGGRFDIILESSGKLAYACGKSMLKPGGTFIDLIPSPVKFLRSALPGHYKVQATKNDPAQLEEVLKLAARGRLQLPIERTVPLADAVSALTESLTEFELNPKPGRGKLVVTMS